jgi:peptidoglycan/xylan/chitin deacetylase (PgdA/CDA1 family)
MIIPASVPWLVKKVFSGRVWQVPEKEKVIYLTFDDGPHERITPKVLALLSKYDARATFFCIGDRVKKHPETFSMIKNQGHTVGNHTYHHVNGWKSVVDDYVDDVLKADALIGSTLFRPPYGRLTRSQFQRLRQLGYQTVMWSILSGDYDSRLSAQQCARRVKEGIMPGAIILFHDSDKAEKNMFFALESLLDFGNENGFSFKSLTAR